MDNEKIDKYFGIGAGLVTFVAVAIAVASVGLGQRTELDVFLRRSRGEKIDAPLTSAQRQYVFEVRGPKGVRSATLSDFDSPLIFLNFWGTFCPPCIEELPSLLAMARARQKEGLLVIAVSYDESFEAIDRFLHDFTSESIPDNFIIARDPEATPGRDMKSLFGTEKIPESYLLKGGRVIARFVNARDWISPDILGLLSLLLR